MKESRALQLEQGLNGVARKVYEAVPAQEPWAKDQICREIMRAGSNVSRDIVDSCLNALRGRGLVKEPERGKFVRVSLRTKQPLEDVQTYPEEPLTEDRNMSTTKTQAPDALGRLAGVAKLLRQAAEEIEAAALDFEERTQEQERDTEKLRQLQALLKSL